MRQRWIASFDATEQTSAKRSRTQPPINLEILPIEMWMRVFELACCQRNPRLAIGISHVSRHFRAIVLQIPKLWSSIHGDQSQAQTEAFLLRSKQSTLHVAVDEYKDSRNITPVVVQNLDRIQSLRYYTSSSKQQDRLLSRLEEQGTSTDPIRLPQLTFMDLWTSCDAESEAELYIIAPRLLVLNMKNTVPQIRSATLRLLTYEVSRYDGGDGRWSADPFFSLLDNLPALEILDLRVSVSKINDVVSVHPTVTARSIRFFLDNGGLPDLARVFDAASFPRLDQIAFNFLSGEPCEILRTFGHSRCPELKSVAITYGSVESNSSSLATYTVLTAFPQIQHLAFYGVKFGSSFRVVPEKPCLRNLETLVLNETSDISCCFPLARYLVGRQLQQLLIIDEDEDFPPQHSFREHVTPSFEDFKALLGDRLHILHFSDWRRDPRNIWLHSATQDLPEL